MMSDHVTVFLFVAVSAHQIRPYALMAAFAVGTEPEYVACSDSRLNVVVDTAGSYINGS